MLLLLALLLLTFASRAGANMAAPVEPGSAVGEFSGDLREIDILREKLTIDLRPLAHGDSAAIEAVYHVRNSGEPRTLELLFVAVALFDSTAEILVDGRRVESTLAEGGAIPLRWRPPATTPPLGRHDALRYEVEDTSGIRFAILLPTGEHRIQVRYRALVMANHTSGDPVALRQLAYVLSPAREWKSFGGLDLTLLVPPEWSVSTDPPLERRGDVLTGRWDRLPADAVAVTLQAPAWKPALAWVLDVALTLLLVVGGIYGCIAGGSALGRWLSRRRITIALALPVALLAGVVWASAVFLSSTLYSWSHVDVLHRSRTYSYGKGFLFLGFGVIAFVAGSIATQVAATVAARRARQRAGAASSASTSSADAAAPNAARSDTRDDGEARMTAGG